MGYGSCPMDPSNLNEVAWRVTPPEDHVIAMFAAMGNGRREPRPRPSAREEVVVVDRFCGAGALYVAKAFM